jgi:hypothetical protein
VNLSIKNDDLHSERQIFINFAFLKVWVQVFSIWISPGLPIPLFAVGSISISTLQGRRGRDY